MEIYEINVNSGGHRRISTKKDIGSRRHEYIAQRIACISSSLHVLGEIGGLADLVSDTPCWQEKRGTLTLPGRSKHLKGIEWQDRRHGEMKNTTTHPGSVRSFAEATTDFSENLAPL